jgi:hypothetical protein
VHGCGFRRDFIAPGRELARLAAAASHVGQKGAKGAKIKKVAALKSSCDFFEKLPVRRNRRLGRAMGSAERGRKKGIVMASFLPTREASLITWSNNFSTLITATPTAFAALNTAWCRLTTLRKTR